MTCVADFNYQQIISQLSLFRYLIDRKISANSQPYSQHTITSLPDPTPNVLCSQAPPPNLLCSQAPPPNSLCSQTTPSGNEATMVVYILRTAPVVPNYLRYKFISHDLFTHFTETQLSYNTPLLQLMV